ncbi:hypothetical protein MVEN_01387400 [Mycena venus]|uniref:Uncharacterized protein n=1 Tax=Mycena venus TaxID=2733690 RepID=A0A8H7CUP7_9AGAR|nr:hypothetical protein MVEN_01387400 [Mycena venus]
MPMHDSASPSSPSPITTTTTHALTSARLGLHLATLSPPPPTLHFPLPILASRLPSTFPNDKAHTDGIYLFSSPSSSPASCGSSASATIAPASPLTAPAMPVPNFSRPTSLALALLTTTEASVPSTSATPDACNVPANANDRWWRGRRAGGFRGRLRGIRAAPTDADSESACGMQVAIECEYGFDAGWCDGQHHRPPAAAKETPECEQAPCVCVFLVVLVFVCPIEFACAYAVVRLYVLGILCCRAWVPLVLGADLRIRPLHALILVLARGGVGGSVRAGVVRIP